MIAKANKEENKAFFDELIKYKEEIEAQFGKEFKWDRGEDKNRSIVEFYLEGVNLFNKEDWDLMLDFLSKNIIEFERVLREPLLKVKRKLNA